jgi:hypothetical protein
LSLYAQYPVPRCPRCRCNRKYRLGFDLREVRRTEKAVLVRCKFCHYEWWSRNEAARGGVLTKEK